MMSKENDKKEKHDEQTRNPPPPQQLIDEFGFRGACDIVGYLPTIQELAQKRAIKRLDE